MVKLCNKCQFNYNVNNGWYARCDLFGRLKVVEKCDSFADRKLNRLSEKRVVLKKYDALGWCT